MIKNVSQILITKEKEEIPPLIQVAIRSVKENYKDYSYTLYDDEKIIETIRAGMGNDALKAYLKIKPYANKASFARYCIVYLLGGWYVDITIKVLISINIPENVEFLGFRDFGDGFLPNSIHYNIQNSFFYSQSKSKILEKAIELVIENCRTENYGVSPICTTGPGVLGRAFAHYGYRNTTVLGIFMPLTPNHKKMNRSYLLPDGTIAALHKNAWMPNVMPADISAFGLKSSNNYVKMWHERDVYDKSISLLSKSQIDNNINKIIKESTNYSTGQLNLFNNIVISLFEKRSANIVQIGTCDGAINDPIYNLIKYKIKTDILILIEPQKDLNSYIYTNYNFHKNKILSNVAIGKPGKTTLYRLKEKYHSILKKTYLKDSPSYRVPAGFVSANCEHVKKHIHNKLPLNINLDEAIEEFSVISVDLKTILYKHNISTIDILQIDIEGFDDEAIYHSGIDIFRPKVINFEHIHLNMEKKVALSEYLISNNYRIIEYSISDTIAIREDIIN